MKTINLTIGERIAITGLFNEAYQRGGLDLQSLNRAMKIVQKVEILDEERRKCDFRLDYASNTITWNVKKDKGKEVELNEDQTKMIKDAIENKNSNKSFSMSDRHLITVAEKLGIEIKEEKKNE